MGSAATFSSEVNRMALVYAQEGKEYHIGVAPGQVGRYVILTGDPGRVSSIAALLENPH